MYFEYKRNVIICGQRADCGRSKMVTNSLTPLPLKVRGLWDCYDQQNIVEVMQRQLPVLAIKTLALSTSYPLQISLGAASHNIRSLTTLRLPCYKGHVNLVFHLCPGTTYTCKDILYPPEQSIHQLNIIQLSQSMEYGREKSLS